MINSNLNYKIFPFFNSVKIPISTAGTSPSFRNNGYEVMVLEIAGATEINATIEGCINIIKANEETKDDSECSWTTIHSFDYTDFSERSAITSNGKFIVPIIGMSRIRIVVTSVTGETTIVGTVSV